MGVVAELAHVGDPVAHAGPLEVVEEHLGVDGRLVLEAVDLLRAAVVARVRVDGVDLDALGGGEADRHHRAAAEAADLDDAAPRRHLGRPSGDPVDLLGAEPALDACERLVECRVGAHRAAPWNDRGRLPRPPGDSPQGPSPRRAARCPPAVGARARDFVAYGPAGARFSIAGPTVDPVSGLHNARHSAGIGGTSRLGEDDEAVSSAMDDLADPVAKIGDLAASAGVRRIHVLAWRDLADVEAGGSEVHTAEVARLWAAAGVEVTMRTSCAQGQPVEGTPRRLPRSIRRAGRYMVFPRAAAAELLRPHRPPRRPGRDLERHAVLSPLWAAGPGSRSCTTCTGRCGTWCSAPSSARSASSSRPSWRRPSTGAPRRHAVGVVEAASWSTSWASPTTSSPSCRPASTAGSPPATWPSRPTRSIVAVGRLVPVKRYDLLVRAAHAGPAAGCPTSSSTIVGDGYERPAPRGGDRRARRRRLGHLRRLHDRRRARRPLPPGLGRRPRPRAHEGWGMTLTEAAACGTPAVATRIAGHADAVVDGSSGLLADDERRARRRPRPRPRRRGPPPAAHRRCPGPRRAR